ncbi:MAG: hypothetical protein NTW52_04130 [Planctomycetota bacterium]|nr:hypothetical protein [Planctomycetota bacterium]
MPTDTLISEDGFTLEQWQAFVCGKASPIVDYQNKLARRALSKFSDPQNWAWTRRLLEQSSDQWVARMVADAYPVNALVHDVCSGAGGDSVALGLRGPVRSLDLSPIACLLCESNLQSNRVKDFAVENNIAESLIVSHDDWVHIDPDRRSLGTVGSGNRTTNAEYFMPPLEIVLRLISESHGGSIKVAPITQADETSFAKCVTGNHLFHQMGKQFISWGNSVRQQRWWWNIDRFPSGTITISTMQTKDLWTHWTFEAIDRPSHEHFERITETIPANARFIGDTDPAVRAAEAQMILANQRDSEVLGSEQGYFFTEAIPSSSDALIQWFEIEEILPLDRKRLRQYLRSNNIGVLEIKVRDAQIIPEVLRKEMKLSGDKSRTLLITRTGKKLIAVIARRF